MNFPVLIFLFRRIIGIKPYAVLGMAAVQDGRVSWSEDDTRTMSGLLQKKKSLKLETETRKKRCFVNIFCPQAYFY